jgi:hypothetical protein
MRDTKKESRELLRQSRPAGDARGSRERWRLGPQAEPPSGRRELSRLATVNDAAARALTSAARQRPRGASPLRVTHHPLAST